MREEVRNKSGIRTLKGIFITIVLGAIGSGLWELFLGDVIRWLASGFVYSASYFFDSYLDFLYRKVGFGHKSSSISVIPYTLVMALAVAFMWNFYFKLWGQESTKALKYSIASICVLATLFIVSNVIRDVHTQATAQHIERSIDILAPYIGAEESLMEKSLYRSINNYSSFVKAYKRIQSKAEKHSVNLPSYEPLGYVQ
jgi:cation transport ATPase